MEPEWCTIATGSRFPTASLNPCFQKAKVQNERETVARWRRCSRSSHAAKRSRGRCANQSNTCLSIACPPTPSSSPITTIIIHGCCHGNERQGRSQNGHAPPPSRFTGHEISCGKWLGTAVLKWTDRSKYRFFSSIILLCSYWKLHVPRATNLFPTWFHIKRHIYSKPLLYYYYLPMWFCCLQVKTETWSILIKRLYKMSFQGKLAFFADISDWGCWTSLIFNIKHRWQQQSSACWPAAIRQ